MLRGVEGPQPDELGGYLLASFRPRSREALGRSWAEDAVDVDVLGSCVLQRELHWSYVVAVVTESDVNPFCRDWAGRCCGCGSAELRRPAEAGPHPPVGVAAAAAAARRHQPRLRVPRLRHPRPAVRGDAPARPGQGRTHRHRHPGAGLRLLLLPPPPPLHGWTLQRRGSRVWCNPPWIDPQQTPPRVNTVFHNPDIFTPPD
jgi:hypothetical protein